MDKGSNSNEIIHMSCRKFLETVDDHYTVTLPSCQFSGVTFETASVDQKSGVFSRPIVLSRPGKA